MPSSRLLTKYLIACVGFVLFSMVCTILHMEREKRTPKIWHSSSKAQEKYRSGNSDFDLPIIFIGGMPRSGTTLMRVMLDAHADIRCGPETHVIPAIIIQRRNWIKTPWQVNCLEEAGVLPQPLDRAMARFILEIIKHHAPPAKHYCNKDPFALIDMKYLKQLFPNAKFIFMIRDGRATAHSIVSRKVVITKVDVSSYRSVLNMWNNTTKKMSDQCDEVGEKSCLRVKYENLVLQPVNTTKTIFRFLEIPWSPEVIHHDRHLNSTKLSKFECSTNQVLQPLYLDALNSWFGHIPEDVEKDIRSIAPMLSRLGYDPDDREPVYGKPDDFVMGKISYRKK